MKSWKTTTAGIAATVAAIALAFSFFFDGDPNTVADWSAAVAAITAGLGLFYAKDEK